MNAPKLSHAVPSLNGGRSWSDRERELQFHHPRRLEVFPDLEAPAV
jgi:hypothetical protein